MNNIKNISSMSMNNKMQFNTFKFLHKTEENIHKAIKDGNTVWIMLSNGEKITLDENCKIGFYKLYI